MITPILKGTKVAFGPVRLSYTHLFSKYAHQGDPNTGKYMTNILIPKNEQATINALRAAIDAARQNAIVAKWQGKEPKKLDLPLRDGDTEKDDELYKGHFYLNAKCSTRPGIIDKHKQPITDEEEIYSGVWAVMSVTFYGYDVNGNRGIACGLNNVMKFKDDDHLGGRASAEADFAGINLDDDDDL